MTIEPFLLRAVLAALGAALAAAPLGCLVLWRRMAYFGAAASHAALLGIAGALALSVPPQLGILAIALGAGWAVTATGRRALGTDSVLGVMAHSGLALGLVAVALLPGRPVPLEAYLFGDVLAVSWAEVALLWAGAAAVALLIARHWPALLLTTLDPDLARAEGVRPTRAEAAFTLALALTVALSIKIVGALLIGALLVIPPAAARAFARSPGGMAALAALAGTAAALGGVALSFRLDTPTGPTIVSAAAALFVAARAVAPLARR